ncbi:MAG: AbfB domain-containing protein [Clostridia bacterium]|nr:AbfB domain-containing protein [Clostridia bacterium]
MKRGLRTGLCFILCAVLILSLVPVINASDDFKVSVSADALTDGFKLYCVADFTNESSAEGFVTVISAVYNSDGIEKSAKKEKVDLDADENSFVTKEFEVVYDSSQGEYARIYFWKGNTLQPVADSVKSDEVPVGTLEEGQITITSDMVFASCEPEGDHRVTSAADGDTDTYWTARDVKRGSEASVTAYLKYDHTITKVGVLFGMGLERQYVFKISTSRDGNNYKDVTGEITSELSDEMQYFDVEHTIGKFVRITMIERVEPDGDNWVQISEIEAYGVTLPVDMGEEVQLFSFSDDEGTLIPTESDSSVADGWHARRMTEENNTSYEPTLGEKLYAEIAPLPQEAAMGVGENALHMVDYVRRDTDEVNGAGGMLVAKQYETVPDKGRYSLNFNMFIPSVMENGENSDSYWSGFSLTDGMVSGGADFSHYAALQIRFEDVNDGKKVKLRQLVSNYFNEGSIIGFMDTAFEKDRLWNITLDVDATARRADITVTDGINTETKPMYFSYNSAEQTRPSQWSGLEAKWLVFNTGAGAKSEIYVDEVSVTHFEKEQAEYKETTLAHIDMSEENNGNMTFKNIADDKGEEEYAGSLGEKLYAELTGAPIESGIEGDALHLYDEVGRVTDEINGAGGVMAYTSFPTPGNGNAYKIDFTLYAPVADEYGGFSLSNGVDGSYGMQLRFAPSKADENNLQLNKYSGNTFNGGDYGALVGSYTAITKGVPWKVSIKVVPTKYQSEITIDDGVNVQTRTVDMSTNYENWVGKELNCLSFNTGIGGFGDIYVGDITVTDIGLTQNVKGALNGMFRLVATHGTGNMLHHQGNEVSDFAEKQDPAYTRFVERSGLMDPDGVSFEVANRPGYFLTIVPGTDNQIQVQPFSNTVRFKANATFIKRDGMIDTKGYGKSTVSYASYRDRDRYLYNDSGRTVVWKRHSRERTIFYQRNEATASRVSDSFKGTSLDKSKWLAQYPWGDSHNHYGLCRESAITVKNGNITLKANKIGSDDWPKSNSGKNKGQTGIDLSSYGFGGWKKWQGYVGVISPHKNYNGYDNSVKFWRQSYMEGTFKQPNCGYGYWTAFWLSGADSWPPETDIFEYLSSSGSAGAHGWYTNMHKSSSSSQGSWYWGSNLRTQFHRYALDWGYDYMDMYYDGQLYARYTGDIVNVQNSSGGCVLVINTGIGGWESSLPSEYGIGMSMEWFKSWQY